MSLSLSISLKKAEICGSVFNLNASPLSSLSPSLTISTPQPPTPHPPLFFSLLSNDIMSLVTVGVMEKDLVGRGEARWWWDDGMKGWWGGMSGLRGWGAKVWRLPTIRQINRGARIRKTRTLLRGGLVIEEGSGVS